MLVKFYNVRTESKKTFNYQGFCAILEYNLKIMIVSL